MIEWADKILREKRYNICLKCEHLANVRICKKCGCFVIGKTKLLNQKCPVNKW